MSTSKPKNKCFDEIKHSHIETIVIALIVLELVFSILIDIKTIEHLNYVFNVLCLWEFIYFDEYVTPASLCNLINLFKVDLLLK